MPQCVSCRPPSKGSVLSALVENRLRPGRYKARVRERRPKQYKQYKLVQKNPPRTEASRVAVMGQGNVNGIDSWLSLRFVSHQWAVCDSLTRDQLLPRPVNLALLGLFSLSLSAATQSYNGAADRVASMVIASSGALLQWNGICIREMQFQINNCRL